MVSPLSAQVLQKDSVLGGLEIFGDGVFSAYWVDGGELECWKRKQIVYLYVGVKSIFFL